MEILADGFEETVLSTPFEVSCPKCNEVTTVKVEAVLRGAEATDRFTKQAENVFVTSQLGELTCERCGETVGVYFGHGEVQPARYRFALYDIVSLDSGR